MTNEYAKFILEQFQHVYTGYRPLFNERQIEANGIAIQALEKQIPQKPIVNSNEAICPKCHERQFSIIDGEIVAGKKSNNCSNCGQAFDWREDVKIPAFLSKELHIAPKDKEGKEND